MASVRKRGDSARFTAVAQALFVTFLWATSWVLIKVGLEDIPALTFAGLRYGLACLCLLPFFLRSSDVAVARSLPRRTWLLLIVLGIFYYAVTQGTVFLALAYLPAVTSSLVLSLTPVVVALLGVVVLHERPLPLQWIGVFVALAGVLLYFYPIAIPAGQVTGMVILFIGLFSNALSSVLGRYVNRLGVLRPLSVTVISMGVGAALLLGVGIATQGMPVLTWQSWAIIAWLAVVNTAVAFTLWNHTLRTLTAVESSIINNTMAIQIPILAVMFLGERLTALQLAGLAVAVIGTLLVQGARARAGARVQS